MARKLLRKLTLSSLISEARKFSRTESSHAEPSLYGVTDGKAVGTYLEKKFSSLLADKFAFDIGNSASGIDFPDLEVDIKVTSAKQPQSSCPFKSIYQKVYGLGYGLLVFVYDKTDNEITHTSCLEIICTLFVEKEQTADYQLTNGLLAILDNKGNIDDIDAFLEEKSITTEPNERRKLAKDIMSNRPLQGYLTISNALQWRLQYSRAIGLAGTLPGVQSVYKRKVRK